MVSDIGDCGRRGIVGDSQIHLSKCLMDISTAALCQLSISDITKACAGVKEESA